MGIISFLISIITIFFGMNLSFIGSNTSSESGEPTATTRRNTARRNDMGRLSASILQYQTNNNGRTPMQQDPMPETDQFIQQYLVGVNGTLDDFMDPDGIRYKLEFSNFDATKSYGLTDAMNYTIYVVGRAACDGERVVRSNTARNYAISYKLEGNGTYCIDSQ